MRGLCVEGRRWPRRVWRRKKSAKQIGGWRVVRKGHGERCRGEGGGVALCAAGAAVDAAPALDPVAVMFPRARCATRPVHAAGAAAR